MKYLIDTHVLLWSASDVSRLSARASAALADGENEILVSAATAWEIATKHRLGRLPDAGLFAVDFETALLQRGFSSLPVTIRHGSFAGALSGAHGDPFDRMLAAQALLENVLLISSDRLIDQFGVKRLW